jgi:hypothetical protein
MRVYTVGTDFFHTLFNLLICYPVYTESHELALLTGEEYAVCGYPAAACWDSAYMAAVAGWPPADCIIMGYAAAVC